MQGMSGNCKMIRGPALLSKLLDTKSTIFTMLKNYLPNPVTRFCTTELKIRTIHKYLKSLGWDHNETSDWVGIRADEMRRAAKIDRSRTIFQFHSF